MKLLLLSSQHLLGQPLGRWRWIITSDLETLTPSLCCDGSDHCKFRVCYRTYGVARCLFRLFSASYRILGCGDQPVVVSLRMLGPGLHEGQELIIQEHQMQGYKERSASSQGWPQHGVLPSAARALSCDRWTRWAGWGFIESLVIFKCRVGIQVWGETRSPVSPLVLLGPWHQEVI